MIVAVLRLTFGRGTHTPATYETLRGFVDSVSTVANIIRFVPSIGMLTDVQRSVAQRRWIFRDGRALLRRGFEMLESLTLSILVRGTGVPDPLAHCARPTCRCLAFVLCLAVWGAPLGLLFIVLVTLSVALFCAVVLYTFFFYASVIGLGMLAAVREAWANGRRAPYVLLISMRHSPFFLAHCTSCLMSFVQ